MKNFIVVVSVVLLLLAACKKHTKNTNTCSKISSVFYLENTLLQDSCEWNLDKNGKIVSQKTIKGPWNISANYSVNYSGNKIYLNYNSSNTALYPNQTLTGILSGNNLVYFEQKFGAQYEYHFGFSYNSSNKISVITDSQFTVGSNKELNWTLTHNLLYNSSNQLISSYVRFNNYSNGVLQTSQVLDSFYNIQYNTSLNAVTQKFKQLPMMLFMPESGIPSGGHDPSTFFFTQYILPKISANLLDSYYDKLGNKHQYNYTTNGNPAIIKMHYDKNTSRIDDDVNIVLKNF